ncbi:MAG: glycosyltransferase family 4 protein [Candidatus Saccharimonadaceae bacterium]
MKLFFDARYTRTDYHDGISRYSAEIGNALARLTPVTFLVSEEGQKKWFPKDTEFIMLHPGTSLKEPWTAQILNKYHPDVVYSPMQTIGTMGRKYKAVLTIHDLIYYRHNKPPKFLPLSVRIGWRVYHFSYWPQRLILKGADLITTVSKTSAADIKQTKMSKKPALVVYNAPQNFNKYPVKHETQIKNIVYMGSFMPYKNVELLIEGMKWLPGRTLHLLSKVNPERKKELEVFIPKDAKVIFHGGVSDDEYESLMADNAVLASASLDEGYGIPVADAIAMGVPVVISDIPVFHEVGGEGASYFDPYSPEAFAEAVKKLGTKDFRDEKIALAKAHIKMFDWDVSAGILLKAIENLIK